MGSDTAKWDPTPLSGIGARMLSRTALARWAGCAPSATSEGSMRLSTRHRCAHLPDPTYRCPIPLTGARSHLPVPDPTKQTQWCALATRAALGAQIASTNAPTDVPIDSLMRSLKGEVRATVHTTAVALAGTRSQKHSWQNPSTRRNANNHAS